MDSTHYFSTTLWTMAVNGAFLLGTLWLLRRGGAGPGLRRTFSIVSLLWLGLIYWISIDRALLPVAISGATFYAFTLGAAALGLAFFYFSRLREIFDRIRQEDLQRIQGLRVFVAAGFLMEGVVGVIPGWFAILDGYLHVSSGFLAFMAALAVANQRPDQTTWLWVANLVGLADIIIIVTGIHFAAWDAIGPFHNMQTVVFYTGVLLLWLHWVSIRRLLHRRPQETSCDTTLFNNVYQPPVMRVDADLKQKLTTLVGQLEREVRTAENDQELIVPFLKIILKELARAKRSDATGEPKFAESESPFVLRSLRAAIETHYREKHSPSEYARLLHLSPDALARLVRKHYRKTPTDLITERIIIEAKRELYLTTKPIKEIAWELGYPDEFYFSRLFKKRTKTSPQAYRETVGFGKGELN